MAAEARPLKHGSADFSDALELAVSAVQDEDLLLVGDSGGANELTIDHIHALSSEFGRHGRTCWWRSHGRHPCRSPCRPAASTHPLRSGSYTDLAYGSQGSTPAATFIGDIIPLQRTATSSSSSLAGGDGPSGSARRRASSPADDEADSGWVQP